MTQPTDDSATSTAAGRSRLRPEKARPGRATNGGIANSELKVLAIDLGTWSSAVTLFDNDEIPNRDFDPRVEQAQRKGLADVLKDPRLTPLSEQLVRYFNEAVMIPAADDRPVEVEDLDELVARLVKATGAEVTKTTRLNERRAASFAIEQVVSELKDTDPGQQLLKTSASIELHRLYARVFDVVPLRAHRLYPLPINRDGATPDISSILAVRRDEFDESRLLDISAEAFGSAGTLHFPGIKRRLMRAEQVPDLAGLTLPAGWSPDAELLLAQSFRDIVRRVEDEVVPDLGSMTEPAIGPVAITYPTTLPPSGRRRMRQLVVDGLGIPDDARLNMTLDEAVAAGLFFVLRSLAGNRNAGIELFKSRSRRVLDARRPTWWQNMLVIDIGGGTTDIALLSLELVDTTDERPPLAPDATVSSGRSYLLQPKVVGTTGHPQLGGDLLTLRMFYWLKAAIADALPDQQSAAADLDKLAPQVLSSKELNPVPAEIRAILRKRVPTHLNRDPSDPGQVDAPAFTVQPRTVEFEKLWVAVENGKAQEVDEKGVKFEFATTLANELPGTHEWQKRLASFTGDITMSAAEFEQLLRPIIEAAAGLGADLVRRGLGGDPGQQLDIVALSGRTTGIPDVPKIVQEVLGRELSKSPLESGPVAWDPGGVTAEQTYAKQAASIGACWAASLADLPDEDDNLALGIDTIAIRVDNLLSTLPVDLGLAGADGKPRPWLKAGQRFDMADPTGRWSTDLFTRSGWRKLGPLICLHRILAAPVRDDWYSMEWGTYRHLSARDRENAPGVSRSDDNAGQIWFQVQIDPALTPKMLLCSGTRDSVRPLLYPDHGQDLSSVAQLELASLPHFDRYFVNGRLSGVPRIEVVAVESGGSEPGTAPVLLFPEGTADRILDCQLVSDGKMGSTKPTVQPGGNSHRAGVSVTSLPTLRHVPPDLVSYRFVVDGVDVAEEVSPPRFRPDAGVSEDTPLWALLDEFGNLRIYAGYPSYLPAASLADMELLPGFVYLADMVEGLPMWNPEWDPFTGDH